MYTTSIREYNAILGGNLKLPDEIVDYIVEYLLPNKVAKDDLRYRMLTKLPKRILNFRDENFSGPFFSINKGLGRLFSVLYDVEKSIIIMKNYANHGVSKKSYYFVEPNMNNYLEAVNQDAHALKYIEDQTEEICLEAVRKDPFALMDVRNQTETICLEAVRMNVLALNYVRNQTEEICTAAINQGINAISFVKVFKSDFVECNLCLHGKLKKWCVSCNPCPHWKLEKECVECTGCIPCPHGKVRKYCTECNPCTH